MLFLEEKKLIYKSLVLTGTEPTSVKILKSESPKELKLTR